MAAINQVPLNTFVLVPADKTRKLGVVIGRRMGGEIEGDFPAIGPKGEVDMVQVVIPTALTAEYQTTGMCCFPETVDVATPAEIQAVSEKSWMRKIQGSPAIRLQDRGDTVLVRLFNGDAMILSKLDWMSLPVAS